MRISDIERLKQIKRALFSLAQGEFDWRISRTTEDDVIESIVVLLNMMAEEMRATLSLYTDLHVNTAKIQELHMVFILDRNYSILYITSDVSRALGYAPSDLLKKSFATLLASSHLEVWRRIGSDILFTPEYSKKQHLILKCKNKMERSYTCGISSIYDVVSSTQYIMVSIYEPLLRSRMLEDRDGRAFPASHQEVKKRPTVLLRPGDRKALHAIHTYILHSLDKPLPHLTEIAHEHGINEFKLKYGFKELYGTSVFKFLKQERMKKARLLIENTNIPINSIAKQCGYMNRSHFSKDFRAHFGITPSLTRKKD